MNEKINIITPPDLLNTLDLSILLVYPSNELKLDVQRFIETFDDGVNVYLYEDFNNLENFNWLLHVRSVADYVILDIDNLDHQHRDAISFLIAHNNVYWLSRGNNPIYSAISRNRIYDLDFLQRSIQKNS